MATIRRIVNGQVEVATISTLSKEEVNAQIANLDSKIDGLTQEILDLQRQINRTTAIRNELQSLADQI